VGLGGPGPSLSNFDPPVNLKLLSLLIYFITNDTLLKMCTGNPDMTFCAGDLDNVYRLTFDVRISPD